MGRIIKTTLPLPSLLLFLSSMPCWRSLAADTISLGQSISGNQTVVSKHGTFELGFFKPGDDSHNYYAGIWYKALPVRTVVWVANKEAPLMEASRSELKISHDGNLVVTNHLQVAVWSSNSTHPRPASSVAVLLDTGNLIVTDGANSTAVVWQSFDHPTDTWLPGSWLGFNRVTRENQYITSWRNLDDPAPGRFSFMLDDVGSNEYFLFWNKTRWYSRTGTWNGKYFSLLAEMGAFPRFNFTFVDNDQGRYGRYPAHPAIFGRGKMGLSGQLQWWIWVSSSQQWLMIWSAPSARCTVYSLCGPFTVCDEKRAIFCRCLQGFEASSPRDWGLDDWSGGCVRRTSLQCQANASINGTQDGFLVMPNMKLPDDPETSVVKRDVDCESTCLSWCNCTAYSIQDGCLIWTGELLNLQQLSEGDVKARTLFLRLAASELTRSNSKKSTVTKVTVGAAAGVMLLVSIALGVAWCHLRRAEKKAEVVQGPLVQFTYSDLKTVTKNFSEMLGKGGFGSVYKGTLPNLITVAVKRLAGHRQGEKQFRAEISTLGTIQHMYLVPLRGFCTRGSERLLVYDYMTNGSLDFYLLPRNCKVLSWKTRFQIILGVARGLAYLHEYCREQIIHCDVKPENILLDGEFCPKVADFGMAKLFGRDLSKVLTTMRGTAGYLAPEWISGMAITAKVDVYSYGMMLFEIISGRRNAVFSADGEHPFFFPVLATQKVHEGEILNISDEKLHGDADMEELTRACRVACWCVQDNEVNRPSMSQVVNYLEGSLEVGVAPVPRYLQLLGLDSVSM